MRPNFRRDLKGFLLLVAGAIIVAAGQTAIENTNQEHQWLSSTAWSRRLGSSIRAPGPSPTRKGGPMPEQAQDSEVFISLGNYTDLGIDMFGQLAVIQRQRDGQIISRIALGQATTKRFIELQEYLDRLSIHAVDV